MTTMPSFKDMSTLQRRLHNAAIVVRAEGDDHGYVALLHDAILALEAANQMSEATKELQTSVSELATALRPLTPVAWALKYADEETFMALDICRNEAEVRATALRFNKAGIKVSVVPLCALEELNDTDSLG